MVVVPFPARILQRSTEAVLIWRGNAKDIVRARRRKRCEVQLAYAIGVAEPVSVGVDCFGTEQRPVGEIVKAIRSSYDLTPRGIIDRLHLLDVDYNDVAAYGHFGRCGLPWEE